MGNLEAGLADDPVAEQQDVQVQCTWAVLNAGGAVAAKILFNAEQATEERAGLKVGFQGNDGVDETRLRGVAHRFRAVERRTADHATEGREPVGRCGQGDVGRAGCAVEIGAHSDEDSLHTVTGYRGNACCKSELKCSRESGVYSRH